MYNYFSLWYFHIRFSIRVYHCFIIDEISVLQKKSRPLIDNINYWTSTTFFFSPSLYFYLYFPFPVQISLTISISKRCGNLLVYYSYYSHGEHMKSLQVCSTYTLIRNFYIYMKVLYSRQNMIIIQI